MRFAWVATMAAVAAGCSSVQDGAVVRFEEVGARGNITQEVPFAAGRMLGVAWDHSIVWRDGADGWTGRKARSIVEPRVGERATVRTAWEEIGGTVIENRGDASVVRMDRPLAPRSSGSGAWIGDGVIGVVVAGDRADGRNVLVRRPASVPAGVAMVRSSDRAGTEVAATR